MLDAILPILIPIGFVALVLFILDKQFHIFRYLNEYGGKIWSWLKSGAR